ncbi:hypothetical protein BV898_08274 [Hypsibius exemplaris]|uniref:Uncharacterized protein n=1 Tax=Hypsibius exemplaris TaxID=2072580 RepID=A0A1W0WR25_HYPEX|nr:hypothetical protein BV898_08274 [Hypsibius exemplaris]
MNTTLQGYLTHNTAQQRPSEESAHLYSAIAILPTNAWGFLANLILLLVMATHQPLRPSSSCALMMHCVALNLFVTGVYVSTAVISMLLEPNSFPTAQPLMVIHAVLRIQLL